VSADSLDELARRLVADAPEGCTPPAGASVAVSAAGREWQGVAGARSLPEAGSEPLAMAATTHHDLASVTKAVATTAAVLRLVSAGKLRLDDPVARFVPSFAGDGKDDVTVRALLAHRGGLWEWYPLYLDAPGDPEAAADAATRLPLRYSPGSGRHYSDLGFVLLGRIVEHATSLQLDAAVEQLVTELIGMESTTFAAPGGDDVATSALDDRVEIAMLDTGDPYPVGRRSAEFAGWRSWPITGEVADGNAFHAFGGVAGHAGLFSTRADLVRFGRAFADPERLAALADPAVAAEFFRSGPDAGQALGFRTYPLRLGDGMVDVVGHPGYVGCAVGFVPGRGVAIAMLTNRLVTSGQPVPTETMWRTVLDTAAGVLAEVQ